MIPLALSALLLAQEDAAALIEKMKAADEIVSENARRDLLALGEEALPAVREAAGKTGDELLRKALEKVALRLELRKAARGIAARWGDRWYAVRVNDVHLGWGHLTAEAKDGKVLFIDELHLERDGQTVFDVKAEQTSLLNEYLTPVQVSVEFESAEDVGTYSARLKDRRWVVKGPEETRAFQVGEAFTTDFSTVRLMTLLGKTPALDLEVFRLTRPDLPGGTTVGFEAEEGIDHGGRRVKALRYVYSDGEEADRYYWIDEDGRLLRIRSADGVEIVLTTEEKAKDLDE